MPDNNNNSSSNPPQTGFPMPMVEEVPNAPGVPPQQYQQAPGPAQSQTPSYGMPMTNNTFGTMNPQPGTFPPPPPATKRGPVLATIVGILFLVAAVGAGVLLVQQQQNINEKASVADQFCGGVSGGNTCDANNYCWMATTTNMCLVNGQPEGSQEYFGGNSAWDGQVCYSCQSGGGVTVDPNQGTICSAGTKIGGNDALCPGGGGGGGGTTAPSATPFTNGACGDHCQTDSQCVGSTSYNVNVGCRNGTCVNLDCEAAGGTTVPGQLCTCTGAAHSCGESCGAGIGLCGFGTSCTYLAKSQCSPATRFPVCAPPGSNSADGTGTLTGVAQYNGSSFESRRCGAGTADPGNNYLWHADFTSGLTKQQVTDLICSGTPPEQTGGQCTNVHIYDTSWNELSSAQLAALQPGATIRVTVMGTATTGAITQARFTFNGTLRSPVTQKKPGTEEFYDEITIPAGATNVTVKGELFHPDLGWF